jgi:hypothetical protein
VGKVEILKEGPMNLLDVHAKENVNAPADWEPYLWEVLPPRNPQAYHIKGAVAPLFVKGPKKGKKNWSKMDRSTVMESYFTIEEHNAWLEQWEIKTGKCSKCAGEGKVSVGFSVSEGPAYKPCPKCQTV